MNEKKRASKWMKKQGKAAGKGVYMCPSCGMITVRGLRSGEEMHSDKVECVFCGRKTFLSHEIYERSLELDIQTYNRNQAKHIKQELIIIEPKRKALAEFEKTS